MRVPPSDLSTANYDKIVSFLLSHLRGNEPMVVCPRRWRTAALRFHPCQGAQGPLASRPVRWRQTPATRTLLPCAARLSQWPHNRTIPLPLT